MKNIVYLAIVVSFFGCSNSQPSAPEVRYIKTKCPKFNASIKIYVGELNATHGAISWVDVAKVESLLKEKNKFNNNIRNINNSY